MKPKKITSIIFIVIGLLALVCIFFPKEGILLKFPGLREVLAGDTTATGQKLSPEELLDKRIADARLEEESQFLDYFKNDDARFYMPNDDVKYLDEFFAALDKAKETPVRVTHYGDSQIEIDRISCILRQELQEKFGGHGVGFVPFREVGTYTYKVSTSPAITTKYAYGTADMKGKSDKYGFAALVSYLNSGVTLFASTTKDEKYEKSHLISKVTVMGGDNSSPLTVSCSGQTKSIAPTSTVGRVSFNIEPTTSVEVRVTGSGNLYGVLLDGKNGVSVDNIPMRGCSGTIFTKINADNLKEHYNSSNVGLIIMQYGGNSMPYIKEGQSLDNYAQNLGKQIEYLHQIAPKAKILFIGPSDMSTRIQGSMRTYPVLPKVVEKIKQVANENNAAFWDMYGVMGGQNSMVNWVKSGLAGSDHIHFTRKGADKVADVLCKSMFLYYDYYKWRTSPIDKDKYLKADSLKNSSVQNSDIPE